MTLVGVSPRHAPFVVLFLLVAACSSSSTTQGAAASKTAATSKHTGATTTSPGATCSTPSKFGTDGTANEVHGTSATGELWGLALGPGHVPPRAGDELKIVWRMTGSGPLQVLFTAPDGGRQPLVFGPEAHGESNYRRPGDEWGTGFRFTGSGCWHIHLTRDDTSGDVWLNI